MAAIAFVVDASIVVRWLVDGPYSAACHRAGVRCSRGSVGDCYDNALAESFFATLEREVLMATVFHTRLQARTTLFDYIECFYNRQRRHSALGYLSPETFERRSTPQQQSNVA